MILCANPSAQFKSYQTEIEEAVLSVMRGDRYVLGDQVVALEQEFAEYIGTTSAIGVANGTDAIELALRALDVGYGDEVITVSHTAVATIAAIEATGADAVLVDVELEYYTLNPDQLEEVFSAKTKAIIAVHLYGFPCRIDLLKKICKKYKILLIEDAAESFGSFYKSKHTGTFGNIGILSFNGNKTITCGGGGMIITDSKQIAQKLKHLSTHARLSNRVDHYHDEVGYNYRMTNLSAAVGCGQLKKISKILKSKIKNYYWYKENFKKFQSMKIVKEPKNSKSNYWLIIGKFKKKAERNHIFKSLKKKGFGVRLCWRPLHTLKIFKNFPRDNLKNTNKIYSQTITFPSSCKINL